MENKKRDYPFLKESSIEDESSKLLNAFAKEKGNNIQAPIPVFDIIEYLGYDIDFRTDGIYQDENILGGLLISKKMVEINENLSIFTRYCGRPQRVIALKALFQI